MRVEFSPAWRLAGAADAAGDCEEPSAEPFEDQLARLAASVGPLRRALAAIAAEVLDTRAYERLGYARLGDYSRERPGVSARQLQDLACVHRRLAELPLLERALVTNRLPWSKVRLIARVAVAADEASWIARARGISTRALEREVRAAREAGRESEEDRPRVRLTLPCTPDVESRWARAREMAERVAGRRLSGAEAFELVVAEGISLIPVDCELGDSAEDCLRAISRSDEHPLEMEDTPLPRAAARAMPGLERLLEGLETASPFALDRRLMQAARLEQTLDAAITPLLQCVTSPEYEWREAYQSLSQVACEQLGMSASKARALLRLGNAASFVPALAVAYRDGALSWVKAQCLLPLLLQDVGDVIDWRPAWVAWAQRVTFRRLEADVRRALAMRTVSTTAFHRCLYQPATCWQELCDPELREQQMCAHERKEEAGERVIVRVDPGVARSYAALHDAFRTLLQREMGWWPTDSEVFGCLLDNATKTWSLRAPGARRPDPVIERDGYQCAVPGCSSRSNLHDHHVVFRSAGGSDAAWNRVTLCAFHHQRGVHGGELGVRGRAPDALVFELGLRANAPPHARFRSGDLRVA